MFTIYFLPLNTFVSASLVAIDFIVPQTYNYELSGTIQRKDTDR